MTAPPRLATWLLLPHGACRLPGAVLGNLHGGSSSKPMPQLGARRARLLVLAPGVLTRSRLRAGETRHRWPPVAIHRGQPPCDMICAMRSAPLLRSPAYTLTAILVLALGIGATSSIFSFVDGVLLRPLPSPNPEQIVFVFEKPPGGLRNGVATANYLGLAGPERRVRGDGRYPPPRTMTLAGAKPNGAPSRRPGIARLFRRVRHPSSAEGGRSRRRTRPPDAIRSWSCRIARGSPVFGADRGIVGRAIVLDGQTFTVVGVLPAESSFDRGRDRDTRVRSPSVPVERAATITGCRSWRMKPGVTLEQARARMEPIAARIARDYRISRRIGASRSIAFRTSSSTTDCGSRSTC